MRMEHGYNSDVGEGGDQLSTGEKQLISFARAVLADPKIFVLELSYRFNRHKDRGADSGGYIQAFGKQNIFPYCPQTFNNQKSRYNTCGKNGKIIERGTHKELLKKAATMPTFTAINSSSKKAQKRYLMDKIRKISLNELTDNCLNSSTDTKRLKNVGVRLKVTGC